MKRLLILLAVVAVAACDESPASPSELVGDVWQLVSIEATGAAPIGIPDPARYTIQFLEAGRVSVRADCNTCGGTYTLNGQTLMAAPSMACTRAACPTMAFENIYMKLLGGESGVSLSGGTLELTSPRGVLRFAR